jgi:uncharacterized membrane protein
MSHTTPRPGEPSRTASPEFATRALTLAGGLWVGATVAGLAVFAAYIAALYAWGLATGDLERWNAVLPAGHGYVPGDLRGNIALGTHVIAAIAVAACGAIQLLPAVRRRAPRLHRWSGRVFLGLSMGVALSGALIALTRGPVAGLYMAVGNLMDAGLVLVFSGLAWRAARRRDFSLHRRWALRAFIVIFGVWFYRLMMMLWFAAHGGPVGHTDAFDGPWDIFLAFGHFLLPLALLELYLVAQARGGAALRLATAGVVGLSALATAAGTVLATLGLWLPRL